MIISYILRKGAHLMEEKNVNSLTEEEVNIYEIDYDCGKVQFKCVTDCPFSTPWMTEDH